MSAGPKPPPGYFLPADTIESRMEQELAKAGLMPSLIAPAVDVEGFVEKHLRARLDQYADLEPGVLGQTEFNGNDPPAVSIDRRLTASAFDDPETPAGAAGRWRATLAHEAAHILFHRKLFAGSTLSLFETTSSRVMHRCAIGSVLFRGRASDWREVQANMGMAALLMPRTIFKKIVRAAFDTKFMSAPTLDDAEILVPDLAERFSVSKQAFRIRLGTLRLVSDGRQSEL